MMTLTRRAPSPENPTLVATSRQAVEKAVWTHVPSGSSPWTWTTRNGTFTVVGEEKWTTTPRHTMCFNGGWKPNSGPLDKFFHFCDGRTRSGYGVTFSGHRESSTERCMPEDHCLICNTHQSHMPRCSDHG